MASSKIPPQTADFDRFVVENPDKAVKAKDYDERARRELKQAYLTYKQGTYDIIAYRTSHDPVANFKATSPKTVTSGPKETPRVEYWCEKCRTHVKDHKRHMDSHNRHPGDGIYCPFCKQRMARADATTADEHILQHHPELLIGTDHPYNSHKRVKTMKTSTDVLVLERIKEKALQRYIELDHGKVKSGFAELGWNFRKWSDTIDKDNDNDTHLLRLAKAIDTYNLPCGSDSLATDEAIDKMDTKVAAAYLSGVRIVGKYVGAICAWKNGHQVSVNDDVDGM